MSSISRERHAHINGSPFSCNSKEINVLHTKAISGAATHAAFKVMHRYRLAVAWGEVADQEQHAEGRAGRQQALSPPATGWLLAAPHAVFLKKSFEPGPIHKTRKRRPQQRRLRAQRTRTASIDRGDVPH